MLSKLLARRPASAASSSGLDPVALVLDSVPDSNGLRCLVVVFTQAVKSPRKRLLATPVLALSYALFALSYGSPAVLVDLRRRLNSPRLVPLLAKPPRHHQHHDSLQQQQPCPEEDAHGGSEKEGRTAPQTSQVRAAVQRDIPRLYFASKADTMTRIEQVKAHMDEAMRAGFDVRAEIFENTSHVSHAKQEPERYWGAIKALWREASTKVRPRL